MTGWLVNLVRNYPARTASLITALMTVAAVVGLPVTDQQATLIVGLVGTVLSALVHHLVTPAPRVPATVAIPPGYVLMPTKAATTTASGGVISAGAPPPQGT